MNSLFSIGELSKLQSISRQTLIFYDKIGLFRPAYVDPGNGYRYYSSAQLDQLDTILIMKKLGFSLEEISQHMAHYTIESSISVLRKQLKVIQEQIDELQMIKTRAEHRCSQMENILSLRDLGQSVSLETVQRQYILQQEVEPPYGLDEVSLATKSCFVRSFKEKLPVFFQSGARIPLENILQGRFIEASHAFLPIDAGPDIDGVVELSPGLCISTYHVGDYLSIGKAYRRLLSSCREQGVRPVSDSFEFAINDYLSTGNEAEYVTKIMIYVQKD